jgi:O-antigen ligase
MRSVTRILLWLFAFSVPWDVIAVPGFGTVSRLFGIAIVGASILTATIEGRFRKVDIVFVAASVFVASSAVSLLWTISLPLTTQKVWTYVQLLGSVWVIREHAQTREQQQSLLAAFCFGAFVPLVDLLNNFRTDVRLVKGYADRFTAYGFNADNLGLLLVIAIPIAWYLVLNTRKFVRASALIFFLCAPLGMLLTGTRGAFMAGLVAMSIVPVTLSQLSRRSRVLVGVLLAAGVVAVILVVPEASWARLATIQSELTAGGNMTGRRDIWAAGLRLVPDHPVLGVGPGTYALAISPNARAIVSHNVPLGVLVEQGIIGLSAFAFLLVACAAVIFRLDPPERKLWAVVMLSWFVGVMSLNWESVKTTWFLFGLLSAQNHGIGLGAAVFGRRQRMSAHGTDMQLRPVYSGDGRFPRNWSLTVSRK